VENYAPTFTKMNFHWATYGILNNKCKNQQAAINVEEKILMSPCDKYNMTLDEKYLT